MSTLAAVIAAAVADFAAADRDRGLGAYGLQVDVLGQSPVEHRFRSDDRVNVYSVAKTFTATALLLAEHEGRLRLDDRFLRYFPELAPAAADGVERVTVRHLLTMTSGTSHVWFADQPVTSLDLLRDVVTAPLVAEPGTRFRYTGSGPYVAGRVLHRATGADLHAYLTPRLFAPLGIHNPAWHTCPAGFPFAESDLYLRTGELARFARLLAAGGRHEGRPLLPAECVEALTAAWVPTDSEGRYGHGYGLGVWATGRPGQLRMDGRYGQYAVVVRAAGLAVTLTAHSERDAELLDVLLDLVVEPIAAAARDDTRAR